MAGSKGPDEDGVFADINVTPLVDITLVLLIVFMVAAPLIVAPSIKVELPKAATGAESEPTTLALVLAKKEGGGLRLSINGEEHDETTARGVISGLLEKDRELQAMIAADKGLPYGEVMHIVDLVKALGVHKFALNTDPDPGSGG